MNYNADSLPTHTVHSQHCTDGEEPKATGHAQWVIHTEALPWQHWDFGLQQKTSSGQWTDSGFL